MNKATQYLISVYVPVNVKLKGYKVHFEYKHYCFTVNTDNVFDILTEWQGMRHIVTASKL